MERVYVDTNILVSYALGRERAEHIDEYLDAKKVFEEAENGKYRIVVSNFVLSETLHALRNVITDDIYSDKGCGLSQQELIDMADSKEFSEKVIKESMKAFRDVVSKLTSDSKHFSIEDEDQKYTKKVFEDGLKVLIKSFGIFKVFRFRCEACNQYISCNGCRTNSKIYYKGVNAPDLAHIFISVNLECKKFLTADKGFEKIADNVPIAIEIIRH